MTAAMSFDLEYSPPWAATVGRCQATIFLKTETQPGVIVITEPADNPGPSVTNSWETIADTLEQMLCLPGLAGYQLVEHYPAGPLRDATFDQVDIVHTDRGFHSPTWTHLTAEQFEALVPADEDGQPAMSFLAGQRGMAQRGAEQ